MNTYNLKSKHKHTLTTFFLTFLLLLAAPSTLAQDRINHVNTRYTASSTFNLTFTLFFLAFIILFIVIAFLVVLFSFGGPFSGIIITERRGSDENVTDDQSGLGRSVLETFPITKFSEVKGLINHSNPECSVCLSEYNDSDMLRVLPGCCHMFHLECIDNWLTNRDICPVCRASLSNPNVISIDSQLETGIERFTVRLPEHVIRGIKIEQGCTISTSITVAGSNYQGSPMSVSGRIWAFIRTFSSKNVRLSSSLPRNMTVGRNSSVKDIAPVRSGSVIRNQTDGSV